MGRRWRAVRGAVAVLVTIATLGTAGVDAGARPGAAGQQADPADPSIVVTELPPVPGGPDQELEPLAINERGQVVVTVRNRYSSPVGISRVYLYDGRRWRRVSPPPTPPYHWARATALTERGDVGGQLQTAATHPPPPEAITDGGFAWLGGRLVPLGVGPPASVVDVNERRHVLMEDRAWRNGEVSVVPTPEGAVRMTMRALNDTGQAVGAVIRPPLPPLDEFSLERYEAVVWDVGGQLTPIGRLGGYASTLALAVNDAGVVAGETVHEGDGLSPTATWVWRPGQGMVGLGTLGGMNTSLGGGSSAGHHLNGRGEVVGWSDTASGDPHAFYWRGEELIDLGTLDGHDTSHAAALNDLGQVVGTSNDPSGGRRGFLWQDGRMIDLSTVAGIAPEGRPTDVYDISNRGQIVGRTWDPATGAPLVLVWTVRPQAGQ